LKKNKLDAFLKKTIYVKLRGSLRKVTEGHGDDKLRNTPFPKVIKIIEGKKLIKEVISNKSNR
jgi:hypothetical protein